MPQLVKDDDHWEPVGKGVDEVDVAPDRKPREVELGVCPAQLRQVVLKARVIH